MLNLEFQRKNKKTNYPTFHHLFLSYPPWYAFFPNSFFLHIIIDFFSILDIYSANKNYAICNFFTGHIIWSSFLVLLDHHVNVLLYLQSSANLKLYYVACYSLIAGIILFGGLLAPTVTYLPPIVLSLFFFFFLQSYCSLFASFRLFNLTCFIYNTFDESPSNVGEVGSQSLHYVSFYQI